MTGPPAGEPPPLEAAAVMIQAACRRAAAGLMYRQRKLRRVRPQEKAGFLFEDTAFLL